MTKPDALALADALEADRPVCGPDAKQAAAELRRLHDENEALRAARDTMGELWAKEKADAARYRWLRDHPLWSVAYRIKPGRAKEWRMRDEGEYWGQWWPTHEQAVDHAMKEADK